MKTGTGKVRTLCAIADVSRKCYYSFLKTERSGKADDSVLTSQIKLIQEKTGFGIGYRQMNRELRKLTGERINSKRTYRLMRENDALSAVRRRKWAPEVYLKRKEMKTQLPHDLLKRDFTSSAPLRKFVTDNTYLYGKERKEYVNIIIDLFNREVVAYSISAVQDSAFCIESLKQLSEKYKDKLNGAILHSDLGSTFMSYEYREEIKKCGMIQSAGEVGICYDNAAMESFNGLLKTEGLYCRFGKTKVKESRIPIKELEEATRKYIEYYNNQRGKKSLNGLSPEEYRKEFEKEKK